MKILKLIKNKKFKIGIVGLGYVGLPLLLGFANKGIKVIGFDIDKKKIEMLKKGKSYINHIKLKKIQKKKNIEFTNEYKRIEDVNFIILCVPTPLDKKKKPDLSYIKNTMHSIKNYLRKYQTISLESTTYPGTTREIILPFVKKKFKIGKNFFLVYSPEREDPGRKNILLQDIPKVLGGFSKNCQVIGANYYKNFFKKIIITKNLETAEFTKIFENVFRAVNISLVNEVKKFAQILNVNFNDVIKASSTKPFGFMPFYPGPGIGGHCIPIDPLYLSYSAKKKGIDMTLIDTSFRVNFLTTKEIPQIILKNFKKKIPKILIIGIAYKKNIDDIRESPALKIIYELKKKDAIVDYHDPFIKKLPFNRNYYTDMYSITLNKTNLKKYDGVLICTDHDIIDYNLIYKYSSKIFDTRNIYNFKAKKIISI